MVLNLSINNGIKVLTTSILIFAWLVLISYLPNFTNGIWFLAIIISIFSLALAIVFSLRKLSNNKFSQSFSFTNDLNYQITLLENIQECIIVVGINGTVQYYNLPAKKLFNLSQLLSKKDMLFKLFPTYSHIEISEIYNLIQSGRTWQGEYEMEVDGEKKTFMSRINPIIYNNRITDYVIIASDITELVQTRGQAQAANLAKNQFLANMSHEIRTPMIGILGAVDLLEATCTDKKQMENINIIRYCGEDLLNIINDILDVSKIEIGLVDLHPENCNLYDLFYRAINTIEPALLEKGLNLELDIKDIAKAEVFLDHFKLRQILTNILFNAIKFTSRGTIRIKAFFDQSGHEQLVIIISDTGIGIPSDAIPYIFDPFSQADNSTSRQFNGAGLGLYICKKLIDLMDGTIKVTSEIELGTEFKINLPVEIRTNYDLGIPSDEIQLESKVTFMPHSILVVEDNELNQKIVDEMLRNFGFEVRVANNGLECLQILEDNSFDLILLDMQMPIMDGYETAQLIRQDKTLKHLPIIAMTAHAMTGDRELCLASGCTSYIAKPFKSEELVAEINKNLTPYPQNPKAQTNHLFINELLPEFFETMSMMIGELDRAVSSRNLDKIKSISHDIKGTSGIYGFADISQLAIQIGEAVEEKCFPKLEQLLTQLHCKYQEAIKQVS